MNTKIVDRRSSQVQEIRTIFELAEKFVSSFGLRSKKNQGKMKMEPKTRPVSMSGNETEEARFRVGETETESLVASFRIDLDGVSLAKFLGSIAWGGKEVDANSTSFDDSNICGSWTLQNSNSNSNDRQSGRALTFFWSFLRMILCHMDKRSHPHWKGVCSFLSNFPGCSTARNVVFQDWVESCDLFYESKWSEFRGPESNWRDFWTSHALSIVLISEPKCLRCLPLH